MIYFQHTQTKIIYKAYTLRKQLPDDEHYMFDAIIAHILYGVVENIWTENNHVLQFLNDYEVLIPNGNVFGDVAKQVVKTAV